MLPSVPEDDVANWYEVSEGEQFSQGEILTGFPVFIPPVGMLFEGEGAEDDGDIVLYDMIVLTQTCDLVNASKVRTVLACPMFTIPEFAQMDVDRPTLSKREYDHLKQGHRPAYHALERCTIPGFITPHRVAHFGMVTATPVEALAAYAGLEKLRLRLLSPYREHLSQAFARFVMRVGLPSDLSPLPVD